MLDAGCVSVLCVGLLRIESMETTAEAVAAFIVLASSGLLGMAAHARLNGGVMSASTADVVRRGTTVLGIMSAVLLAALTVTLKSSFDTADQRLKRFSSEVQELDRTLRRAGDDAIPAREALFRYVTRVRKDLFPQAAFGQPTDLVTAPQLREGLRSAIETLAGRPPPENRIAADAARQLQEVVLNLKRFLKY